jgi:hypothetical protein
MSNDLLEVLQADVLGVLQSVPGISAAKLLADNEGDIEARVMKALAPMSGGESLLSGLAIVVLLPEVTEAEDNMPGPPFTVRVEVQVIEQVMINRSSTGTGVRSSQAAMEILRALHLHQIGAQLLYSDRDPIQPLPVKAGHVSHAVRLLVRSSGLLTPARVSPVTASLADDTLTLTTATSGAVIRYTTDGSYPAAPHANLYTEAIPAPESGTFIRAVATAPALNPSDLLEFNITE